MSDDLLSRLRVLENEYAGQPLVAQQADLLEINRIRSQVGMPLVDAHLKQIGAVEVEAKPAPATQQARDHTEARAIYEAYLNKLAELEPHRAYADRVARATGGPGQTPVWPLATLGTDGGPLLCDHCRKPIVLEGGRFQGVNADVAWRQNPDRAWKSWISGGMVVEIQSNGTLRIYHGYPGRNAKHCCNIASKKDEQAQAKFQSVRTHELFHMLLAFAKDEFPDLTERARFELLNEILNTLYSYDPGIGINRPSETV